MIDGQHEFINGYDLSPKGIIKHLNLEQPVYEYTASFGHMGEYFMGIVKKICPELCQ